MVDEHLRSPLCEDHATQGAARPDGVLPPDEVKELPGKILAKPSKLYMFQ